jgi:hypothetical protein
MNQDKQAEEEKEDRDNRPSQIGQVKGGDVMRWNLSFPGSSDPSPPWSLPYPDDGTVKSWRSHPPMHPCISPVFKSCVHEYGAFEHKAHRGSAVGRQGIVSSPAGARNADVRTAELSRSTRRDIT